ncbi:MAG: exodeoxyribonuclease VII large subunit [Planctomycetaceae bacterium]|nr:exodeoxyribonuclease VII large subunit [Planctomycetaceae bacterium]
MAEVPVKSVSEITWEIKELVEASLPYVAVLGEISNCRRASSGHYYLTLKDESSQLPAVIWRSAAARLKFEIKDGMEVVAAGPIEVYHARGSYQLIVNQLIPQGLGPLELAFRQLQEKLAAEGLFDPEHKKPLPRFPKRLALITSPAGAAVRDMLQVITRRWPGLEVLIIPVAVQGEWAAREIADAFRWVSTRQDIDVVITGRGGGSLEDLWPFNEEVVARAIHACPIPVVSAVGHEIDVSISDLVADRRALTPSEAAELVVPLASEIHTDLTVAAERMRTALRRQVATARVRLESLESRAAFARPHQMVSDRVRQLDDLDAQMQRAVRNRFVLNRERLASVSVALDALSPLNVLARGYSITQNDSGNVIQSVGKLNKGDRIVSQVGDGKIVSVVEETQLQTPTRE